MFYWLFRSIPTVFEFSRVLPQPEVALVASWWSGVYLMYWLITLSWFVTCFISSRCGVFQNGSGVANLFHTYFCIGNRLYFSSFTIQKSKSAFTCLWICLSCIIRSQFSWIRFRKIAPHYTFDYALCHLPTEKSILSYQALGPVDCLPWYRVGFCGGLPSIEIH